ncbi:MAG: hypothetical protein ACXVXP_16050 [Mycobacteriaceae bacterium]|jgi:hypothetical protein
MSALLAAAFGALLAAAWFLVGVPAPQHVGGIASAEVVGTASCSGDGRDVVVVAAPAGAVTTTLDGCGRPVGAVVTVNLSADGSVPNPVSLAGTRGEGESSALPPLVLGMSAVLAIALGVGSLRASTARTSTTSGPAVQG